VLWHGMGDSCCFKFSMGHIERMIQDSLGDVYVHSIEIGDSMVDDVFNSYFKNINKQVDMACQALASDPNLALGFNAIGFSQGSQFLRAYIQRCNNPPVYNFVSLAGQHQGIFGFPNCPAKDNEMCELVRRLLTIGAYEKEIQSFSVQAEYWHDPINEDEYLEKGIFLPDINNNLEVKNQTYKENLVSLNKFCMVRFSLDTMVQPIASEWFGFYEPGQDQVILSLQETELYKQDWLGLKKMDQDKKLDFLTVVGDHLEFSDEWFEKVIIPNYLNNTISS